MKPTRAPGAFVLLQALVLLSFVLVPGCQQDATRHESVLDEPEPSTDVISSPKGLAGRWQGTFEIGDGSGSPTDFAVSFRERDGSLSGTVDIRGRKGIPMESASYEKPALRFDFQSPNGTVVFSGEVAEGDIRGAFEMPENQGTFSLSAIEPADIDSTFASFMAAQNVPGVAAATVRDGEIVWVGSYGWANVAEVKPVTRQTVFLLASK